MLVIRRSANFDRKFRKLPLILQTKTRKRAHVFARNPFEPTLKTHKLKGELKDVWAFWVDRSYRVTFKFGEKGEVIFADIGTHDEVY